MYILLSARPPFGGEDDNDIMQKVSIGRYDLESSPFNKLSKSCLDLIKRLLTMDPNSRINAEQSPIPNPQVKYFLFIYFIILLINNIKLLFKINHSKQKCHSFLVFSIWY